VLSSSSLPSLFLSIPVSKHPSARRRTTAGAALRRHARASGARASAGSRRGRRIPDLMTSTILRGSQRARASTARHFVARRFHTGRPPVKSGCGEPLGPPESIPLASEADSRSPIR
jgi:hypothetical protein